MIAKIFILGMIFALVAIILEKGAGSIYNCFKHLNPTLIFAVYAVLGIGFIEEILKYLVLKFFVLKNREFDEPIDVIIYLITIALGFVAMENIFLFLRPSPLFVFPSIAQMIILSVLRTLSATLLHALCSGILGYFIALGFYKINKRTILTILGIALATLLHGLYDFFIMNVGGTLLKYGSMAVLLISMGVVLSVFILKIKKVPSICR